MNSIYDRNKKDQMGPEMMALLSAITHFGCLTKEQAIQFMPKTAVGYYSNASDTKFKSVINSLRSTKRIKEIDNFVTALNFQSVDYEMIDAVWVLLEMVNKFGKGSSALNDAVENSLVGSANEKINFILNRQKDIHIIPVYSDSDITEALFIQNKYFANGNSLDIEDSRSMYVFMFRSPEVFTKFKTYDFTLPYMIAYLMGEDDTKPEIKLLSKQPKTE